MTTTSEIYSQLALDVCPRGSSFYYATRKVKAIPKQMLVGLFAFKCELEKISEHFKNPDAAGVRLAWWQQEIDLLFQNQPRHPISQTLSTGIARYQLKPEPFLAQLEAAMVGLQTQLFETPQELYQHCQHTGGIFYQQMGTVLGAVSANDQTDLKIQTALSQLGVAYELIRHINHFAVHQQRQQLFLPAQWVKAQGSTAQSVLTQPNLDKLIPVFKQLRCEIETLNQQGLSELAAHDKKRLKPLLILTRLRQKLLTTIAHENWNVLQHAYQLTPIQKLLISL